MPLLECKIDLGYHLCHYSIDKMMSFGAKECNQPINCVSVDDVAPVVTCVDDIVSQIGINIGGTVLTWTEPTATDNSGVVSLSSRSHSPGSFFQVGTTQVTYVFVDGTGNSASCIFSATVNEGQF